MPANDLHVNLDTPVRPDVPATATPTPSTVTPGPSNLSLDTGFGNPVPNGQTATLNYATLNPSSKVTGGTWTQDGNVIGSIPTEPLHLVYRSLSSTSELISLVNYSVTGTPLAYSSLSVFENANIGFYEPNLFVAGLFQSGRPAELLAPREGLLMPGTTDIAILDAPLSPLSLGPVSSFYDGGTIRVNDQFFAEGVSNQDIAAVPEPGSLSLLLPALTSLGVVAYRRWTGRNAHRTKGRQS